MSEPFRFFKFESMIKRKAFALRIEKELYAEVEKMAKEECRSVNGQIEWMLRKVVTAKNRN